MTTHPRLRVQAGVSIELLEALQELFPNRLPDDPSIAPQELGRLIGHQDVIRLLKAALEEQSKKGNILKA